ncbi:MAG: TIGR00730 family Rossman fold protein [Alphaproteobacteria bacterium]
MIKARSICVYCGSNTGTDPVYREAAARLGRLLAESGTRMVFGGGDVGLMGVTADAALSAGGTVVGVIPQFLVDIEAGHAALTELIVVSSMHERKHKMFELSDAFVVLPGGLGTLDETIEIITWKQLHLHDKPIVIVDVKGYWTTLLSLVDDVIAEGFANDDVRALFSVVSRPEDVLGALAGAPEAVIVPRPARI